MANRAKQARPVDLTECVPKVARPVRRDTPEPPRRHDLPGEALLAALKENA